MRDRSFGEPTEYIIWMVSGLLASILGLGAAFLLWAVLHRTQHAAVAAVAVGSLAVGLALIGLAAEKPVIRLSFVLFAAVLAVGYAFGAHEFARLIP